MSNPQPNNKPNPPSGDHNTPYSAEHTGQAFTATNFSGITAFSPHFFSGNCISYNGWSAVDFTWIIDTGASDHMCHNANLFTETHILPQAYHITLPNGHVVHVHKVGSVRFHPDIILHNVLHVPQFKYNLLSIGKLCSQTSSFALFTNSKCYFQGPLMKRPLELGEMHSGLYLLQNFPPLHISTDYNSTVSHPNHTSKDSTQLDKLCNLADFFPTNKCNLNSSILNNRSQTVDTTISTLSLNTALCNSVKHNENGQIWHQRLGHLPLYKLQQLSFFPNNSIDTIKCCNICPQARQHRLPFPLSQTQSTHLF